MTRLVASGRGRGNGVFNGTQGGGVNISIHNAAAHMHGARSWADDAELSIYDPC